VRVDRWNLRSGDWETATRFEGENAVEAVAAVFEKITYPASDAGLVTKREPGMNGGTISRAEMQEALMAQINGVRARIKAKKDEITACWWHRASNQLEDDLRILEAEESGLEEKLAGTGFEAARFVSGQKKVV